MDRYLINDLERLTGIKAHTIRIWEKRYNIIEPSRTDTNRRYYTGEQLIKLMNVATLLNNGFKISQVAELTNEELNRHIERLHNDPDEQNVYGAYVHDLAQAMVTFDEEKITDILNSTRDRFGFQKAVLKVYYPFLHRTGMLWRTNQAMPVEEHFASNIIRRKIVAAIDHCPPPDPKSKKFVLFLPPNEWHDIGLLFASYILRSNGFRTIYLGQNVPISEVAVVTDRTSATDILLFYISPKPVEDIRTELSHIAQHNPATNIYYAGATEVITHVGDISINVHNLPTVESLLKLIQALK